MMFFVQCRQTCPPVERAAGALAVRLGSCLTEAGVDGGNAGGILAIRCELRVWQPGGGPARHRDAVRAAFLPAPSSAPAPLPRRTLRPVRRLEYDLHIRPDTLNTRHRVWFYFAVRGATRGQKVRPHAHAQQEHSHAYAHAHAHAHAHARPQVIFNVIGYSKTKSLYRDGMAPVVSTSARPHCAVLTAPS